MTGGALGGTRMRAVSKPDVSQVGWIVRERARGKAPSAGIAEALHVDVRTVQRLWARFRHTRPGDIECPARTGGPQDGLPGRRGHGAVAGLCAQCRAGASGMGGGGHRAQVGPAHIPQPNTRHHGGKRVGRGAAQKTRQTQVDPPGMRPS